MIFPAFLALLCASFPGVMAKLAKKRPIRTVTHAEFCQTNPSVAGIHTQHPFYQYLTSKNRAAGVKASQTKSRLVKVLFCCAGRGWSYSHRREKPIHRPTQCPLPQGQRAALAGENLPITFLKKVLATTIYGATLHPTPLCVGCRQPIAAEGCLNENGRWTVG